MASALRRSDGGGGGGAGPLARDNAGDYAANGSRIDAASRAIACAKSEHDDLLYRWAAAL